MADVLSKAALEAETSDALALAAELRASGELDQGPGALTATLSRGMAESVTAEFAGMPGLGRVMASVAGHVHAMRKGAASATGIDLDAGTLVIILMLAGEQLDREARERHGGVSTADDISALWGVAAEGKCPTRAGSQARNGLQRAGIATVGDLLACTVADLEGFREFGDACMAETLRVLSAHGLALKGEEAPGGQ